MPVSLSTIQDLLQCAVVVMEEYAAKATGA
jgi:hypothetical protein